MATSPYKACVCIHEFLLYYSCLEHIYIYIRIFTIASTHCVYRKPLFPFYLIFLCRFLTILSIIVLYLAHLSAERENNQLTKKINHQKKNRVLKQ